MNVDALRKGLLQLRNVGDMREDAQFDLAVIGRDDLVSPAAPRRPADLASGFRADRDVLQVRLGRRQPSGGGCCERVGGVHALRLGMHVLLQRVGIGRFQLRELTPFENLLGQRMARPAPVRRAGSRASPIGRTASSWHPGRPILPNRMSPICFGEPSGELLAGHLLDLVFEARKRLGEIARQAAQDLPVDRDAAHLPCGRSRRPAAARASRRPSRGARPAGAASAPAIGAR